jgi:hypothetical protein
MPEMRGNLRVVVHIMLDEKIPRAKPQRRLVLMIFLCVFASLRENTIVSPQYNDFKALTERIAYP